MSEHVSNTQSSWRKAQLSSEDLAQKHEQRRLKKEKSSEQNQTMKISPSSFESTDTLPWQASTDEAKEPPKSWREAQLSSTEVQLRDEARALRAGEKAEKRATKRSQAILDWECAQERRTQERQSGTSGQTPVQSQSPKARQKKRQSSQTETPVSSPQQQEPQSKRQRQRPPINAQWVRDAGLRYLGRFSASEAHFRRVLTRKIKEADSRVTEDPHEHTRWIDEAVQYAYQYGGLNDEQFARSLIHSMRKQGLSTAMIKQKLRYKGLEELQIKRAFEEREEERNPELDQLASAARIARKKKLGPWGVSGLDYPARQKQLAVLARRGFSFGIAKRVLEADFDTAEEWANMLN